MTNTTTQGCEHLDEPYRKLLDEREELRQEIRRMQRQRGEALRLCRDRWQYGEHLSRLVNADAIRDALGG